jgi:lipopolysaccharide transport system ATP-binding protein
MDQDILVSAQGLTKAYRIWDRPSSRLVSPALAALASAFPRQSASARLLRERADSHYRDFFALRDVSFELRRGEALGIVGRNGSGKSTLLQILARTLEPTAGGFSVEGRMAALLELGSGFNPEFTGRENVMLNGAILGFSRRKMESLFPQIAEFADIGDFIDEPVKTYSSGMFVRLAFAVAVSVQPDILIVDEALSVGDFFFAQKCFTRIREILNAGASLLFVTHDTTAVVNLCRRAIWLEHGVCRQAGQAESVVRAYLAAAGAGKAAVTPEGTSHSGRRSALSRPAFSPVDISRCQRLGNQQVAISGVWNTAAPGAEIPIHTGDWLELLLAIDCFRDLTDVSAGFEMRDRLGQVVHANGLRAMGQLIPRLSPGTSTLIRLRVQCLLAPGRYTIDVGCGDSREDDNSSDRVVAALVLVVGPPSNGEIVHGMVKLPLSIEIGQPTPLDAPMAQER